jgi:hypothetical protein
MVASLSVSPPKTPEQIIDGHADAMADIAKKLLADNERLRRQELNLISQVGDALDRVFELETQLREKDQIIAELQEIRTRGAR